MKMIHGQQLPLSSVGITDRLEFSLYLRGPFQIDYACFGVDKKQKLTDDRFVVFYNQPSSPAGAIWTLSHDPSTFTINLTALPSSIDRLVFTASIDGEGSMKDIGPSSIELTTCGEVVATCEISGSMFGKEASVIVAEIYRQKGKWWVSNTLKGHPGGLASLVEMFGGGVENEPASTPAPSRFSTSLEDRVSAVAPSLKSHCKKAQVSLEKKGLTEVEARVLLVLDASTSMRQLYENGRVQEVLTRVLPLAAAFDDEARVEVFAFNVKATRLSEACLRTYRDFINLEAGGWPEWDVGDGTIDHSNVVNAVMDYVGSSKDKTPTFVLCLTAGGVSESSDLPKLMKRASSLPAFWQFIGLAGNSYGGLEKLPDITGQAVKNCDFFDVDDLDELRGKAFYDRIMDKFPRWLEEAEAKGIIELED